MNVTYELENNPSNEEKTAIISDLEVLVETFVEFHEPSFDKHGQDIIDLVTKRDIIVAGDPSNPTYSVSETADDPKCPEDAILICYQEFARGDLYNPWKKENY